ncbi:MAG: DUF1365 domain-containing protein [Pseudomonadota bacterium]
MKTVDHIAGHTWHGRKGAVDNAFRYSIDYLMLDAEAELETPWAFGRNRAGLASLWDSDHGGPPKQGRGAAWVREVLEAHGFEAPAKIELLAQPRVLGHVFNPVAFWICRDDDGQVPVVISEVSNTYGDRHSYLCHREDRAPIGPKDRMTARKIFHVSPFQKIEGGYEFRFDLRSDRIGIWIDFTGGNGGLIATLVGNRKPLTTGGLVRACLRRPFGSRRVLALIHWQALKLWFKGARFRNRPEPPAHEVSR